MTERNRSDQVEACNAAARRCIDEGDPRGACEHLSRALHLLRSCPDPRRQAALLSNLGHVQVSLRRLDEAAEAFREAALLFERLGDRKAMAWQMGNVGSVCRDREDYGAALESYGKALSVFEEQNDSMGIADQYSNIGYIHAMKREPETALGWFQKAQALYASLGHDRKASLAEQNIRALTSSTGDP